MSEVAGRLPEFVIRRPPGVAPWVLWGGALPGGTLKYLTFQHYLATVPAQSLTQARGLIEMSEGCSALALEALGRDLDLTASTVCSEAGSRYLRAQGFRGDCLVCHSLGEAFALCQQKAAEGWIWPQQMTNRALIDSVIRWAEALERWLWERSLSISEIVTGFGTGATAVGLSRVFRKRGVRVLAVESRAGQRIPGWRHFASQNLGPDDLFAPFLTEVERVETRIEGAEALDALLAVPSGFRPEERLVISHQRPVPGQSQP